MEQERKFVGCCSQELDVIAQAAIEFAVALWVQCSPDWEEPSQSVSEARTELVSEVQIAAAPPARRLLLEATKRDVADAMTAMLWRAASEVGRARAGRCEAAWHGRYDDDRRRGEPDVRGVRDQASNRAAGARGPVAPRAGFAQRAGRVLVGCGGGRVRSL